MGEISRQLHGKLKAVSSSNSLPTSYNGRKPIPGMPDITKLIAEGMDPIHVTYVFIHHIASVFAEIAGYDPAQDRDLYQYYLAEQRCYQEP
jgi:hypothetical protein